MKSTDDQLPASREPPQNLGRDQNAEALSPKTPCLVACFMWYTRVQVSFQSHAQDLCTLVKLLFSLTKLRNKAKADVRRCDAGL